MKIPKTFKMIGDKKPCHMVGTIMDGNTKVIIYKQWIPWKRYYIYKAIEWEAVYEDLYYQKYKKNPW